MSYMLQHLVNGWQVDQAILSEEDRLVVNYYINNMFYSCIYLYIFTISYDINLNLYRKYESYEFVLKFAWFFCRSFALAMIGTLLA